ncbi:MAG: class I SAM-dependent methyltransferase [Armatimonadota bacterium]
MGQSANSNEFEALAKEAQDSWNRNAEWWDEYIGAEGNNFHRLLVAPAMERLLELKPDELVLDVACGNGQFARRMAELGTRLVAFDFSERFIERAKARTTVHAERIQYIVLDATDRAGLLALGTGRFDAAVCTMALMDMVTIEPLISALSEMLNPGGRFVFSVLHPCFNSTGTRMVVEEEYQDTALLPAFSVKVTEYIRASARRGVGIVGQPVPQYYFHRPIGLLFSTCFQAGFVLDGLEEPVFNETIERRGVFSWSNYLEIPPVLVARMRLLPA